MPLNVEEYMNQVNKWEGIKEYVLSKSDKYTISPKTDNDIDGQIYKMIKNNADSIFEKNTSESFKRAIRDLKRDKRQSINRENCLRLIFALLIDSIEEANLFLTEYIHENCLSEKNINEFIIGAGINLKLDWETINSLRKKTNTDDIPVASDKIAFDQTILNAKDMTDFDTKEDLYKYLENSENLTKFALTRNTQYLALFSIDSGVEWYNFIYEQNKENIDSKDAIINHIFEIYGDQYKGQQRLTDYYHRFFSLCSDENEENIINPEEILLLSKVFPEAFYTYETFRDAIFRNRKVDISSGIYIIHILPLLEADDSDDFSCDYLDKDSTIEEINDLLLSSGLPLLNDKDSFCRLVMDSYEESLNIYKPKTSQEAKSLFLSRLRSYLKDIAKIKLDDIIMSIYEDTKKEEEIAKIMQEHYKIKVSENYISDVIKKH